MASGLMSTAYTVPDSTRRAARTVNHPDPAPMSATFVPGAIPRVSITRLICSRSSRPGVSKIDRSPVYGVLVFRPVVCCAGDAEGEFWIALAESHNHERETASRRKCFRGIERRTEFRELG